MMFRAAVALLALALPAFAQHGGSHAGSSGSRGFSGNATFSSHPAFSQPSFSRPAFSQSPNFARPAQPARYGPSYGSQYRPMPGAGYRPVGPASRRSPYNGNRSNGNRYIGTRYNGSPYDGYRQPGVRAPYNPSVAALSRGPDRNHDRDRFDARRRQFQNWYVNTYPYWSGYPYLLNPNFYNLGLYDWSDSDNSAADSYEPDGPQPGDSVSDEAYDQNGPAPDYPPYPNQGYTAPNQIAPTAAAPPASAQPLTVIFKSSRAPIQVQNYLITTKVLTDLDSEHYEQIPLDEINLAATQNFNKVAGVDFQVPTASRD